MALVVTEGEDKYTVEASLEHLQKNGWHVTEDRLGIRKRYYFKTFTKVVVCAAVPRFLVQLAQIRKGFLQSRSDQK